MTFRLVVVSLRGPGQSPVLPFACCSVWLLFLYGALDSRLFFLRRVAAFCQPLRPVLLLVSFPRSRSPVGWCAGAVLDVAGCAVCALAAPSSSLLVVGSVRLMVDAGGVRACMVS